MNADSVEHQTLIRRRERRALGGDPVDDRVTGCNDSRSVVPAPPRPLRAERRPKDSAENTTSHVKLDSDRLLSNLRLVHIMYLIVNGT